ncbi:MAG: fused MFS/spermidine synthase [Chloroflexi bacterium]|nr:fused MFS/spermidine synthase [Chloroflexota bacterium]
MQRLTLIIIFFLSGLAALIHQLVWMRQATLLFGGNVYAYSAVFVATLGGAALGAYWLGQWADRVKSPLVIYALLQVGLGLLGALAPFALLAMRPLYTTIAQWFAIDSAWINATRVYFAMLGLMVPSLLIGATLPFMARAFVRQAGCVGRQLGQLYMAQMAGAAVGSGLTGLVLLPSLGAYETAYVAAGLNGLLALGTLWIARSQPQWPGAPQKRVRKLPRLKKSSLPPEAPPAAPSGIGSITAKFVFVAYTLSGFIGLGDALIWTRILSTFTANTVFSFSIVLSLFLLALAAGSGIGIWWTRRRAITMMHFAHVEILIGLTAMLTLFIFAWAPNWGWLTTAFSNNLLTHSILLELWLGLLTVFVPAALLGLLFPVVTSLYTQESAEAVGKQVGRLYAFYTISAILGALIVAFVAIPRIGLQATAATFSVLNLIIGVVASWLALTHSVQSRLVPQGGLALGIALILLLPPGYYLGFHQGATEQMKFYAEGPETIVAVFDAPDQKSKRMFVNGGDEVATDPTSLRAFRLLGHLPALLNPEAQSALMLGFGNGIVTGSLNTHNLARIDAVDRSTEQFKAAELYQPENYNVLHSQVLHKFREDERNFLAQTLDNYDIITTDILQPVNANRWMLFTQEFYNSVATHLTPKGLFMQWLPFDQLSEPDYKQIIRTFQTTFPNATLWYTGGNQTLLLAPPYPLSKERLLAMLGSGDPGDTVVPDDLGTPAEIASYLVMDADALQTYGGRGLLVTDQNAFFLPDAEGTAKLRQMLEAGPKAP